VIVDWLLVLVGLALLIAGGEALVRGGSGIALLAKISPTVVGLTIVAAGTSAPELVVSVQAAFKGSTGLALGNVVGSNLFNMGMTMGLAATITPLAIVGNTVRLEWPVMTIATAQLYLLARDGTVDRLEGAFLFGGMVVFIVYSVWVARKATIPAEQQQAEASVVTASFGKTGGAALALNLLAVLLGVGMLAGGSTALVNGAVSIATTLGLSDTVIGLTIVAGGTGTPELVTTLLASRRGQNDVAIANILGSNIFNVLGIAGATALIHPLPVPEEIITRDGWWLIGASLLLFPLMRSHMKITRVEGLLLLAGYVTYMVLLINSL